MQIHHDGVTLNLAEDGDPGAPPLLLLHGITSFGGTWEWIVPELAERFRVLRLDFRGHGASDRTPGEYGSPGYVSDAIAACEQAIGRAVHRDGAFARGCHGGDRHAAATRSDPGCDPRGSAARHSGDGGRGTRGRVTP